MTPLRQQLAYIRPTVMTHWAETATDERMRDGLAHWAMRHLPLVVTRQDARVAPGFTRLGLPLPKKWDRLRVERVVALPDILYLSEFPTLPELIARAEPGEMAELEALCLSLHAHGLRARVYGSHGWQHLSGMRYIHAASDMDLLIAVNSVEAADTAARCLSEFETGGRSPLRLDGELQFRDGTAVAWREWAPWRNGRTREILIKQPEGVALVDAVTWSVAA